MYTLRTEMKVDILRLRQRALKMLLPATPQKGLSRQKMSTFISVLKVDIQLFPSVKELS